MTAVPPSESAADRPPMTLEEALEPFPYQRQLIEYLRSEERDLWTWFASAKFLSEYADSVRLELLKATYRFDPSEHARIYELANASREVLQIEAPVTLYQSTDTRDMNASLAFVPGEVHIILHGPVTTTLTDDELKAALAHELTHYVLWDRYDRDLLIAHQLLEAMADHPQAAPAHVQSARLFSLYTEMHADRGSLFVMNDALATIRSLIKIQTGLMDVHAESYLRQADEIFARGNVRTKQLTHPESFVRARALRDWADHGRDSFAAVAAMIEGSPDIGALDLVAQLRFSALTRELLSGFVAPRWLQTDAVLAHARKFFPDLQPAAALDPEVCRAIGALDSAAQEYFGFVLLDFVVADPDLEEVPVAAVLEVAERCGMRDRMLAMMINEISLPKKRLQKIDHDRAAILAAAEKQGAAEAAR